MFKFLDAYAAKFYFDRLRVSGNLLFDSHYNICESILKNAYVCQQVKLFNKGINSTVLDLGCGNGHLSRTLARLYQIKCVGFDPNISLICRLKNHYFNFKNLLNQNPGRVKLYKKTYAQFFKKIGINQFNIIIDNCSVTHFDVRPYKKINFGWKQLVENLAANQGNESVFICATDVIVGTKVNSEFVYEFDLLNYFKNNDFQILNQDQITIDEEFENLVFHFSEFVNFDFKRVPPPKTVDGQALGILGFIVKRKCNL
jgi:SAM-dependent methyltransferase